MFFKIGYGVFNEKPLIIVGQHAKKGGSFKVSDFPDCCTFLPHNFWLLGH